MLETLLKVSVMLGGCVSLIVLAWFVFKLGKKLVNHFGAKHTAKKIKKYEKLKKEIESDEK